MSAFNFDHANVDFLFKCFDTYEQECRKLIQSNLPLQAYEMVLKASHTFNLLDARGAISVTERVGVIARVRKLAVGGAQAFLDQEQYREVA